LLLQHHKVQDYVWGPQEGQIFGLPAPVRTAPGRQ